MDMATLVGTPTSHLRDYLQALYHSGYQGKVIMTTTVPEGLLKTEMGEEIMLSVDHVVFKPYANREIIDALK